MMPKRTDRVDARANLVPVVLTGAALLWVGCTGTLEYGECVAAAEHAARCLGEPWSPAAEESLACDVANARQVLEMDCTDLATRSIATSAGQGNESPKCKVFRLLHLDSLYDKHCKDEDPPMPGWTRTADGAGVGATVAHALAFGPQGNLSLVGYAETGPLTIADGQLSIAGLANGDVDSFWAKLGPDGRLVRSRALVKTGFHGVTRLAVASDGTTAITGTFEGTANLGGDDLVAPNPDPKGCLLMQGYLVVYHPDGSHRWSKMLGAQGAKVYPHDIAISAGGEVTVVGSFAGTVDLGAGAVTAHGDDDVFIARYRPDGTVRWTRHYGGPGPDDAWGVVDTGRGVVAVGSHYGGVDFGGGTLAHHGGFDGFVVALDQDGDHQWSRGFGASKMDSANKVARDAAGNLYISGFFREQVEFGDATLVSSGSGDAFVAKLNSTGTPLWATSWGGTLDDSAMDLALSQDGAVHAMGFFEGASTCGGTTLTSQGDRDIFVARIDAAGNCVDWRGFGGDKRDAPGAIAVGRAGTLALAGGFVGTVDFGHGPVTSEDDVWDLFVACWP